jgi:hypothetical protein
MKLYEKLDAARSSLKELFSDQLADDCINYLISKLAVEVTNHDILSDEQANILFQMGLDQMEIHESDNVIDLILELSAVARERSHGAAPLSKVYISTKDYHKITDEVGIDDKTIVSIGKVRIYKSDTLTTLASVFGVCTPKFKCVSPELMVILGRVKE